MKLKPHHYYHLYNRTNNKELLFKEQQNYLYFLKKFRERLDDLISVHAYCLMPTHFHFLVRIDTKDSDYIMKQIGIQLSSYTKAINKRFNRHGSLFQRHTKLRLVDETNYLLTLISYIHQNPIRRNLVSKLKDWPFSSYRDLAGYRNGTLPVNEIITEYFRSNNDFITFSEQTISKVRKEYWV